MNLVRILEKFNTPEGYLKKIGAIFQNYPCNNMRQIIQKFKEICDAEQKYEENYASISEAFADNNSLKGYTRKLSKSTIEISKSKIQKN